MLPKQERLDRKDIELFFSKKTSFYKGRIIILKLNRNKNKKAKWAFVISSSIKKNAVARNKIRRRMNEIAQELKETIPAGLDMVFMIKINTKQPPSFEALKNDMIHVLKSCGVLL